MTDLTSIAGKLAKYVRLLASDKDGEVVAAARAMQRTLLSIGADFHCLADRVERSNGGQLSQAEMRKIYDAGVKEGIKIGVSTQQARRPTSAGFSDVTVDGFPSARDMAMHCYRNKANLKSEWEIEFVTNMASWTRTRPLSEKQQAHLEKIYIKLGGRI
jgi:hypothetical protein